MQPAGDLVTLVAEVTPAPAVTLRSGAFQIAAADGSTVAGTAEPVVSAELATGLVLDTSAAGAAALQVGASGAASFLLQLPDDARTMVVADGGPPRVLAPLSPGASTAIAALTSVRPDGERQTAAALTVAVDGLPAVPGRPRLLLLYTGSTDAGGEAAADLARRLRTAGVLLAVVSTGDDQRYWSQVVEDTGGVLVSARGPATLSAFDQLAAVLRARYAVSFPRPPVLPATVRLSVQVGRDTAETAATVPAEVAGSPSPGGTSGRSAPPWWAVLVLVLAAVAFAAVALLARRRRGTAAGAPAAGAGDRTGGSAGGLPAERAAPEGVRTGPTRTEPPPAIPGPTDPGPPAAPAADQQPTPPKRPTEAPPAAGPDDRRAYRRLDAEAGRAAAEVVRGQLDSAQAVARIAFAAGGRLDLLDRVIETERLLSGAELGASPPPATVLSLLTAARRIVAGEVALVGPAGVRVEQRTRVGPDGRPRPVLRLTGRDRSVRECRTAGELARHVDLATLTPDAS
ncbi:MAG: VWA domain-containing protein [Mycobacteriales bacterium]